MAGFQEDAAATGAEELMNARQKVEKLLKAARDGELAAFKEAAKIIADGQELGDAVGDVKDENGRGPIHCAARGGHEDICKYLVEELHLCVDPVDDEGETPLIFAAREGSYPTAKYLLDHGANPHAAAQDLGTSTLHHAAGRGSLELIKHLLEKGVAVDVASSSGTPLMWAARHGRLEALELLLERGADANSSTEDGATPLLTAVAAQQTEVVELLIKHGAETNIVAGGVTPLHIAAEQGNKQTIKLLLAAGANPNLTNEMPFAANWPMNTSMLGPGFDFGSLGPPPLVPVLIPGPFPSFYQAPGHEQHPHQGGVFAVPIMPIFGPMGGIPQGGFIPLSFNVPPAAPPTPADGQAPAASPAGGPADAGRAGQGEGRDAPVPDGLLRQRHVVRGAGAGGRADNQRVVRRFRVGFQVDLLLILKLAVVVFVFNQDGSKDRLMLLLLLAGIVYLYQTGALAPILRWVSQSAQRAMMPPQQPLPVPEGGQNREVGGEPQEGGEDRVGAAGAANREAAPLAGPGQEGVVGQAEGAPGAVGVDGPGPQNPNWWGFFKEVQMIVVGFLTSLLPGFQHVD